jgi:axin 1
MQSLSSHSDARTESDNMSTKESNIDGKSGHSHRKSVEERQMRQFAARNKETNVNHSFIPRTQRTDVMNKPLPMEEHAALLIQKLEELKREQESQELLHRRLKEGESAGVPDDKLGPRDLETAMREKLQFHDDNDQDILDEHVSRVFSDHSLAISPGLASPKAPSSPPRGRWGQPRPRRREKDVFSTFSGDSGNVHDFSDEHRSMTKSKSIPEYGNEDRFSRATSCRRSATKKTLTDLTDSGVSVVSDSASVGVVQVAKDSRVLTWLMDSDRSGKVGGGTHAHSEMAVREGVSRKYAKRYGSRSNSLERNSVTGPAQPFIADPSMPPLPLPNTDIQLEEIRRRLTEDDIRTRSRQRSSNKYYPEISQSGQSTLRKTTKGQRPTLPPSEDVTVVVFSFCDEQFPYRTKIPGSQITLRQFKEYLPKKGNYRFFFKTVCEDLSNQVTHEEVSNDSEVLPLWEGKIMAQVKPID